MNIEEKAKELLQKLSKEVGCNLEIKKIWPEGENNGFYCRFYGILKETDLLKIEVAGSLCHRLFEGELNEEVDLFIFLNGERLTINQKPGNYLWKHKEGFNWDDVDEGYHQKNSLKEILLEEDTTKESN